MLLYHQGRCFSLYVFLFQIFLWLIQFFACKVKKLCVNPYISLFHNTIYIFIVYSCFTIPLFFFLLILLSNTSCYLFFLSYECVVTSLYPSSCHHVSVLIKMYIMMNDINVVCNDNSSVMAVFLILIFILQVQVTVMMCAVQVQVVN